MHYPPDTQVYYKPDNRVFASYPMPAKIDLVKEKRRQEEEIEQQLSSRISPTFRQSPQNVKYQQQEEPEYHQQQQHSLYQSKYEHQQHPEQYQQQQQQRQRQRQHRVFTDEWTNEPSVRRNDGYLEELEADLVKKEAELSEDITAMHVRPYNVHQLPSKIDIQSENRRTAHYQSLPRTGASSSSTLITDLASREAELQKEIAELERKPYNPQKILVEHEKWYEYPQGHPEYKQLADTKRRVKDFCSLPAHLYPDYGAHIHEEGLSTSMIGSRSKSPSPLSVHTAVIKTPKREIDNRSPLPFSFDNFSTGGIKGNIATVGAVEPERPYPPINPVIVRRTPSPNLRRD